MMIVNGQIQTAMIRGQSTSNDPDVVQLNGAILQLIQEISGDGH